MENDNERVESLENSKMNLFKILYKHRLTENELTQALSYFLQTDNNVLKEFISKTNHDYQLITPEIITQKCLDEGIPDLIIHDKTAQVRILVEVKLDARETGGDQLKRYSKSLENFSRQNPDWKTSLILLSKHRMDNISSHCHEMLWCDIYEILCKVKIKNIIEEQFIIFMEEIGLANKPIQFEGINKEDVDTLQKFGNILEGLKEMRTILIKNLETKVEVKSKWRVSANGVDLLSVDGDGYKMCVDVYWSPEVPVPDEYDVIMEINPQCIYVNLAFEISKNQELKETLIGKGFYTRCQPYIQKAFKIESLGRDKQIEEILKIVKENVPEMR